jgi:hypothetical protein
MPRAHVEFVQSQVLPWLRDFLPREWGGVEAKALSVDPGSGACSLVCRYPRGWRAGPHHLLAAHELYVLDGSLEINGNRYGLDDYAWLPAGWARSGASAAEGAVVLTFFDRRPEWRDGAPVPGACDASGVIERIDTHNMPWHSADIDPDVQFLRLTHKVLRSVPATGERTILLNSGAQTHPRDWREAALRHDCVEEMFMLGGDMISDRGTMYEGAYFWRPPGEWHGPFGSRRGSLSLIRMLDGRHSNQWGDDKLPFTLTPPYSPVLPDAMREAGIGEWSPMRW